MPRVFLIVLSVLAFTADPRALADQEPIGISTAFSPGYVPAPTRGVVILVGGIGGFDFLGRMGPQALPGAGVTHEIREFVWTHGRGHYLKDLQDSRYLNGKARELAAEILEIKTESPARPVFVVGHSAGAAIALEAASHLPPSTLERLVLLSSAVAPNYDLRPALWATRGEVVSFHSGMDWFVLGWATRWFGTADRVYGPAAGFAGFEVPRPTCLIDRELYQRFVQISWKPEMLAQQYVGLHSSTSMPGFLSHYVAPWLKP